MADEMRKYRVTYTKTVLAIDRTMAQSVAQAYVRRLDVDRVTVVCTCLSTADRATPKAKRTTYGL